MSTIKWVRPSGSEIETNATDAVIAHAVASGWKRAEQKPRRGRPPGSRNKPQEPADELQVDTEQELEPV